MNILIFYFQGYTSVYVRGRHVSQVSKMATPNREVTGAFTATSLKCVDIPYSDWVELIRERWFTCIADPSIINLPVNLGYAKLKPNHPLWWYSPLRSTEQFRSDIIKYLGQSSHSLAVIQWQRHNKKLAVDGSRKIRLKWPARTTTSSVTNHIIFRRQTFIFR